MKTRIKSEFIGKTIIKQSQYGDLKIVIDEITPERYAYVTNIGLGYIFEEVKTVTYVGVEEVKKPKKTKEDGSTESQNIECKE
jgi:hypothetical protein